MYLFNALTVARMARKPPADWEIAFIHSAVAWDRVHLANAAYVVRVRAVVAGVSTKDQRWYHWLA